MRFLASFEKHEIHIPVISRGLHWPNEREWRLCSPPLAACPVSPGAVPRRHFPLKLMFMGDAEDWGCGEESARPIMRGERWPLRPEFAVLLQEKLGLRVLQIELIL